jgi:hypothetical protein
VLEFSLDAFAQTLADPDIVPRAELRALARAVADPVLSFDQAAFDAMAAAQGFPIFNLADNFRFEFSPMLFTQGPEPPPTSGVPSPSTIALTSLSAGGLVLLHGLRHRWPRHLNDFSSVNSRHHALQVLLQFANRPLRQ